MLFLLMQRLDGSKLQLAQPRSLDVSECYRMICSALESFAGQSVWPQSTLKASPKPLFL